MFEQELSELAFHLKETPWTKPVLQLVADLTSGRNVATDTAYPGLVDRADSIARLRRNLTEFERDTYRTLCSRLSHAVQATCRMINRGETEWEVAAHLAHRLMHRNVELLSVHVYADDRAIDLVNPKASDQPVERSCTIQASARYNGLCATTSRTVTFGPPSDKMRDEYRAALLVTTTGAKLIAPNLRSDVVVNRMRQIYKEIGHEYAWRTAPFAGLTGYSVCEEAFRPDSTTQIEVGNALFLIARIGSIVNADCALVSDQSTDFCGSLENWPVVRVTVQGTSFLRPDILIR